MPGGFGPGAVAGDILEDARQVIQRELALDGYLEERRPFIPPSPAFRSRPPSGPWRPTVAILLSSLTGAPSTGTVDE
jgi:hypothetical protein